MKKIVYVAFLTHLKTINKTPSNVLNCGHLKDTQGLIKETGVMFSASYFGRAKNGVQAEYSYFTQTCTPCRDTYTQREIGDTKNKQLTRVAYFVSIYSGEYRRSNLFLNNVDC